MASRSFRIGVSTVSIPINSTTALPTLSTLVYTASATQLTAVNVNDVQSPLSTTTTYQVCVGLVGRDTTNKGYSVTPVSPGSGLVSVSSTQGILVNIPNANWPANYGSAICAIIFMAKNGGSFQIHDFAYIDTANDFNHMIVAEPLLVSQSYTYATLQETAVDLTNDSNLCLGNRAPLGVTWAQLTPTTGGVHVARNLETVTLTPDDSAPITVGTTRSTDISFQLLSNGILDIVRAWAGNYSSYTSGAHTYEEALMSLTTGQVLLTGNSPIKMVLPVNKYGKQETRLYLGTISQVQTAWTEDWTHNAQVPVTYNFSTVSLDSLIVNRHVEISYIQDT